MKLTEMFSPCKLSGSYEGSIPLDIITFNLPLLLVCLRHLCKSDSPTHKVEIKSSSARKRTFGSLTSGTLPFIVVSLEVDNIQM